MKHLSIVFFLCVTLFSVSGKNDYHFSNLSLNSGLSQITVTCIYQDTKGFMWFGTRNGLNRFDGYRFEVFVNNVEDSLSISDNHILCISEDKDGNLWIGTNNGLNKLDIATNKFTHYFSETDNASSLSHNTISSLCYDKKENLWIGTTGGLNVYNPKDNSFNRVAVDGLSGDQVNVIVENSNKLYLGTLSHGLIIYDTDARKSRIYKHNPLDSGSIGHNYVRAIQIDKDGNLWVGTHHNGLSLLKKGYAQFLQYNTKNGLTNNYVRCISESPEGDILVGTFNGLNVIEPRNGKVTQYKSYNSYLGNLSHYSIFSIMFDRSQTLWVGTYAGGIDYYSPYGQKFKFYDPSSTLKSFLGIMGPMVELNDKIYIATEGGGLLELDKSDETFKNYKVIERNDDSYSLNILKSLHLDGQRILCGTNIGTIYSFDLKTKKFSLFYDFKEEKSVYYIGRAKNGDLIIGGVSHLGLTFISSKGLAKNTFKVKGQSKAVGIPNVRCVLEIQKNVFLVGTRNDGLYQYNLNTDELVQFKKSGKNTADNQIPDNYISSIFKDSKGNIWVGTFGGGFCLFDSEKRVFTVYDIRKNLLNNNVCTIAEDNNQHLWISTIEGVSKFDLQTQEFNNYTHANGIGVSEFTPHAGITLSNNRIMFSGNNGFISFDPMKMAVNPFVPPIVLDKLYINNILIYPSGEDGILSTQLFKQKKIELQYDQSNITIEYSALNFIFANRNQYAYMLEGFDQSWNEVGNRRVAYYTNVPPGKYKFRVKGSNNDGVWNEEGASIDILITPPLWKTWWAYCIYIISILSAALFVFRYFSEKKRLENDIKLKQMEMKSQYEFNQARNRLFTNFSHELRTPLTLIISPLDDIVEKGEELDPKIKNTMKLMRSNALRLLRIVNNLMDFQKKESGTMKLKVSQSDMVEFSEEMTLFFQELALSRNIDFEFNHIPDVLLCWFDKSLMEKVYFNFLSNAFKNVPNGGSVEVDLNTKTFSELIEFVPVHRNIFDNAGINYLVLEIKDSGVGIDTSELESIFEPFYQVAQNENSTSGTGLGLSLSKSIIEMHHGIVWAESPDSVGAKFTFVIPISKDYFKEEDIITDYEDAENLEMEVEVKKTNGITSVGKKKKYTVLVVEDNTDVRQYIITHLIDKYNILEASNGSEAIDKAVNNLPDLVISDLMMPKMDGIEMCSILKKDLRTSHIPVIMITARSMSSDMKEGYEVGADDYIVKPFNSSVLVTRVDNLIQSREKLKEIYGKRFSLESLGVEATSVDERFMQKLYAILEKNVSNPDLNLDSFCQEIGMSRANLYRKIKSITDLAPNVFVRNFRLEMAAKMLKEAKLTVSDVYVAVGFNSLAYFSNCFKALYGISPTEYINNSAKKK